MLFYLIHFTAIVIIDYFLQIVNEDQLCFLRAVVPAKAYDDDDPQKNTVRRGDTNYNTEQTRRMKALKNDAGIGHDGPCVMDDYEKVQACSTLKGYQLKIFDSLNMQELIFQGAFVFNIFSENR